MTTAITLENQTVEYMIPDYDGMEVTHQETHTVRNIENDEPEHLGSGMYEFSMSGVITWQGEHHRVTKTVIRERLGSGPEVRVAEMRAALGAWSMLGEVVGYESWVA